jgi:hypothetical protein
VAADGETLNAKREPDPDHNDLWDMRLKFKLRYAETAPAFVRPYQDQWLAWQALTAEERPLHYFQAQFTQADETDDDGQVLQVREVNGFAAQPLNAAKEWSATQSELLEKDTTLSAGRYKAFALDTSEHADPAELIGELKALEDKIQGGLDVLLAMVKGKDE